jgi:hypothetical protein
MSGEAIDPELRQRIVAHFQGRCAYCRSPLMLFPGSETIDHILPRAEAGPDDETNLCVSCWRCNLRKAARLTAVDPLSRRRARLFHPRRQRWSDHFTWNEDFTRLLGRTICGRATIVALDLNADEFVKARERWAKAGWHPSAQDAR